MTHVFGICTTPSCPCVREPEPADDNPDLMTCDRCNQMTAVLYVLRTEILDLMVCRGCIATAVKMGIVAAWGTESAETA